MNPRDLPEVVAELIIEMHEVRSEINALNGRVDRLEHTVETGFRELRGEIQGMRGEIQGMRGEMQGMRGEMQGMPERIGAAVFKSLEPFLNRLLQQNDQLKDHETRLGRLENPAE